MTTDTLLPAIVIPCFERPDSLERLLSSLSRAKFPSRQQVSLVFSVDHSGSRAVSDIASAYDWRYGEKRVVCHPRRLGLRENVLWCGDQTEELGAVIVLEDDLIVSPNFYTYAVEASLAYRDHSEIAGVSLYAYDRSEIGNERLRPL